MITLVSNQTSSYGNNTRRVMVGMWDTLGSCGS